MNIGGFLFSAQQGFAAQSCQNLLQLIEEKNAPKIAAIALEDFPLPLRGSDGLFRASPGIPVAGHEAEFHLDAEALVYPLLNYKGKPLTSYPVDKQKEIMDQLAKSHNHLNLYTLITRPLTGRRLKFHLAIKDISITDRFEFVPKKTFTFLGITYEAGMPAVVNPRTFMESKVEWASLLTSGNDLHLVKASGIEMKLRLPITARPFAEINNFFEHALGIDPGNPRHQVGRHSHLAKAVPNKLFKKLETFSSNVPDTYATGLTAHNISLQMARLLNGGFRAGSEFNHAMNSNQVPDVFNFFRKMGKNNAVPVEEFELKFMDVAPRKLDKETFSDEFRITHMGGISTMRAEARFGEAAQLAKEEYASLPWKMIDRFQKEFGAQSAEVLSSLWYMGDNREKLIVSKLSAHRELKEQVLKKFASSNFVDSEDTEVAFVLSNWDLHPFIRYDEKLLEKTLSAQERALKRMLATPYRGEQRNIAREFWRDSNLDEVFYKYTKSKALFDEDRDDVPIREWVRAEVTTIYRKEIENAAGSTQDEKLASWLRSRNQALQGFFDPQKNNGPHAEFPKYKLVHQLQEEIQLYFVGLWDDPLFLAFLEAEEKFPNPSTGESSFELYQKKRDFLMLRGWPQEHTERCFAVGLCGFVEEVVATYSHSEQKNRLLATQQRTSPKDFLQDLLLISDLNPDSAGNSRIRRDLIRDFGLSLLEKCAK